MALEHFKQAMDSMMKNYTVLNPRDGLLCRSGGVLQNDDGRPVVQEFVRGGIVRAWVAWEAYISELLEEAFWKAIELGGTCGCAAEPIRFLKEKWPQSDTQDCLAKLNADEDSLEDNCKLKDHLEKILRPMAPVFVARQLGINKVFSKLFDKTFEDVPSRILTVLSLKDKDFRCPFQFSDNTSAWLAIKEKDGIRDVLRLYYGMRCVLTHGCMEKTLKGCLREFPEKPDDLKVEGFTVYGDPSDNVSSYLTGLYHKLVAEKKNVLIEYADLVNMTRFLKRLAVQLMFVLKLWFCNSFQVDIW